MDRRSRFRIVGRDPRSDRADQHEEEDHRQTEERQGISADEIKGIIEPLPNPQPSRKTIRSPFFKPVQQIPPQ